VQLIVDRRQATQLAKLLFENALKIAATQRTHAIVRLRTFLHSLAARRLFLCIKQRIGRSIAIIVQTGQDFRVVRRHPRLHHAPREPDRHRNRRSSPALRGKHNHLQIASAMGRLLALLHDD